MADRYLSEEAVIRALEATPEGSWKHIRFTKAIRELPAADVKPVVHGYYIGDFDGYADGEPVYDTWSCSECGCVFEDFDEEPPYNFCPNCGADMRDGTL